MRKLVLIIVGISLLLTGCWDYREVDRLAPVLAIGIDCVPGNKLILLTAQIANSSSQGGAQQSKGQGGDGSNYILMNSEGKTLSEAIRNLSTQTSRLFLLAHCKIIILGKDFAECGADRVMDELKRDREFRRTDWMLTTDLTAKEILEKDIAQEQVPARGLDLILQNFDLVGNVPPVDFNDFSVRFNSASHVCFTPLAQLEDIDKQVTSQLEETAGRSLDTKEAPKTLIINKTAVYKNLKMVGVLDEDDSKTLKWLVDSPNKTSMTFMFTPQDENDGNKGDLTLDINYGQTTIIPHISDDGITMNIDLNTKAILQEAGTTDINILNPKVMEELQAQAAETMKLQLEHTINTAQKELKTDFLGFAEIIQNYYPAEWKQIRNNWDEIFPTVKTQLTCEIEINRAGLATDPSCRSESGQ